MIGIDSIEILKREIEAIDYVMDQLPDDIEYNDIDNEYSIGSYLIKCELKKNKLYWYYKSDGEEYRKFKTVLDLSKPLFSEDGIDPIKIFSDALINEMKKI